MRAIELPAVDVTKLNPEQLKGKRCVVCKSDFLIHANTGAGGRIPQIPAGVSPTGEMMSMCFRHVPDNPRPAWL